MNVLVADDDPAYRATTVDMLEQAGYQVTSASDGREALDVLADHPCQMVVSDWAMPRLGGVDLCRAVRRAGFQRYVYFILLTSQARQQDAIEGLAAGADDYIAKPFTASTLLMRVNTGRRIVALDTRDMTIFAMAKLAESRDSETGAHLERVRSYCRLLAQRLRHVPKHSDEIDEEYLNLIYATSPLHDIGKVAIPDRILLKPGRLTDAEFEIMKTHALRGAETLAAALTEFPNARFLQMAYDIALTHHERYDGTGYPQALAGDAIPLCGRIVGLADVYDALTSRRVYKEAYSHNLAKSIIVKESEGHFDPDVLAAFLAEEYQFLIIGAENPDPWSVPESAATANA
jgi:putative two-component system response regulator